MLQRGFEFAPGYRLQEFLGRGQFGQVWRATAPGGTAAAVKFIDLTDGQGQKEYAGIKRVKQIRQANLMPITAIWLLDSDGKVIEEAPDEAVETIQLSEPHGIDHSGMVVMPQVEPAWLVVAMLLGGKSLLQRLKESVGEGLPGIPPKELLSYMDDAAKGLDFLNDPRHDLGEGPVAIQHCDVKPANIVMIGTSAVVCDFGLARILTRNQITATSASGTPAYMAPEAISGKPSSTSDQYSLAVTYYHLRTATLPVTDGTLWEVLEAHRRGQLNFTDVTPSEQAVLRKATALDWQDRFESNMDMVDALREALRHEGHTRPSFLASAGAYRDSPPPTGPGQGGSAQGGSAQDGSAQDGSAQDGSGQGGSPADTAAWDAGNSDDPTATLASEPAPSREVDPGAYGETAAEVQAERATDAEFSFPSASPAATTDSPSRTPSPANRWLRQPAVIASAVGVLALLTLMGFWIAGSDGGGSEKQSDMISTGTAPSTGDTRGGDGSPGSSGANKSASEWLSLAIENLATGETEAVEQFESAIAADASLAEPQPIVLSGHEDAVEQLLVTPSGRQLVSLAYDPEPFLWPIDKLSDADPAQQTSIDPIRLDANQGMIYPEAIRLSGDGRQLLSGGAKQATVWALDQQDPSRSPLELSGHDQVVIAVAWHPSDEFAVTASGDGKIGIWRLTAGTSQSPAGSVAESNLFETVQAVRSLQFHPSGEWLVTVTERGDAVAFSWPKMLDTLKVDSAPTSFPIKAEGTDARVIGFPTGGDQPPRVAVGSSDGSVTLWEINQEIHQLDRITAHQGPIESMRIFSDDTGSVIATAASDGSISVWDHRGEGEVKRQPLSDQPVPTIDISSDGRWVAAGSWDGSVWLWDWASQPERATRLDAGSVTVENVTIDPRGRWVIAGCGDGTIRLWDYARMRLLALSRNDLDSDSTSEELPEREVKVDPLAMRLPHRRQ